MSQWRAAVTDGSGIIVDFATRPGRGVAGRARRRLTALAEQARGWRWLIIIGHTRTLRGDSFDRLREAVRRLGGIIGAEHVDPLVS